MNDEDRNAEIRKLYAETMALSTVLAETIRALHDCGVPSQPIFDQAVRKLEYVKQRRGDLPASREAAYLDDTRAVVAGLRGMVLGHETLPPNVKAN